MTTHVISAMGWIVCGVLAYGIAFAWNQRKWPRLAEEWRGLDMAFSISVGLFGPIGLIAIFVVSGFGYHGLKLR